MIKKFYLAAWILLAAAVSVTVLSGYFTPVALLVFSLVALVLVHALSMWSVIVNTQNMDAAQP